VDAAQASGAPPEKTAAATTAKAASEILMRITPEMSVAVFLRFGRVIQNQF
jgi:hypothetical protein